MKYCPQIVQAMRTLCHKQYYELRIYTVQKVKAKSFGELSNQVWLTKKTVGDTAFVGFKLALTVHLRECAYQKIMLHWKQSIICSIT